MKANYHGYEELQRKLHAIPKYGQEDAEVIAVPQIGMMGVGSLNENNLRGRDINRVGQASRLTGEGAVGQVLPCLQGDQHLLRESLVVDIPAGGCQAGGGALLGAEEEMVHMDHGTRKLL